MRVLVIAVKLFVVLAGLAALGQVLARRRTVGDETSDEFAIAVYVGGVQRVCRASALRRGDVTVVFGGVDLDLREAVLDPEGATLELAASWGGINVTVPPDWRVVVEHRAVLGGVDAKVTEPERLPDDAPELRVGVTARLGGVSIRADAPAGTADAPAATAHDLRGFAST
jgi:predicted membrane protein